VESYEKIMGLVEDVRGIIGLHESKKKIAKKFKKGTPHDPFKNVKSKKPIGKTKGVASNPRLNYAIRPKARRWRCRCHGYKCHCKGFAPVMKDGKPVKGKYRKVTKKVNIDRGYKKTYNMKYKKWRAANPKHFSPGKGSFKKAAKKHHKSYHTD